MLLLSTKNGNTCGGPIKPGSSDDRNYRRAMSSMHRAWIDGGFGNFPISQKPRTFVGHNGNFKSCTSNSFSM